MTDFNELVQLERKALAQSRAERWSETNVSSVEPSSIKAICLSGGGVRSATFATGIFNRWAKQKGAILRRFDYLSTVSGGGYFGAFYGRLFQNPNLNKLDKLYEALETPNSQHIKYLKRSGRYLANSGDEGWFAAATLIRNLIWLHLMLALLLFPVFALLHYVQSAEPHGDFSYIRAEWFTYDNFSVYGLSLLPAAAFLVLTCFYFLKARTINANSSRWLTDWQKNALMAFTAILGLALLTSAAKWLVVNTIRSSPELIFTGLYATIATLSAGVFRIQAKIQQLIGIKIKAKTFVLIIAILFLFVYSLCASAMTLVVFKSLHDSQLYTSFNLSFESSVLILGCSCLLVGFLLSVGTESVNHTSLHYFYAARLRRAFLGAANSNRFENDGSTKKGSADYDEHDDVVDLSHYTPHEQGGPFHLINTTLNSSRSPDGNLWWPDCKGFNLAFSPLAYNYDHGRYQLWRSNGENSRKIPNLGTSVAISGAAASTGMGQLSSFAGGVLTALLNIRTGFWWHYKTTGNHFYKLYGSELLNDFQVKELFPVRKNKPPKQSHWYLSDGGHFENLAVYEMIRRGVPRIVAIDAGCDAEFKFEDLTNLILRARLDFQCELEIVTGAALGNVIHTPELQMLFGTLDQLQSAKPDPQWHQTPSSTKRAIMLRGTYRDKSDIWILYIKPTLTRQEPADLLSYQIEHPDFPHQSTADQFFDEAQWESYRRLGEITAQDLETAVTEFLS